MDVFKYAKVFDVDIVLQDAVRPEETVLDELTRRVDVVDYVVCVRGVTRREHGNFVVFISSFEDLLSIRSDVESDAADNPLRISHVEVYLWGSFEGWSHYAMRQRLI